jgi:hypothetical protein
MNSERYCALLTDELKPVTRMKQRGRVSKTVLLQHDNARPQLANKTFETNRDLKFELLKHSTYSLDHPPSNFHIFGPLKRTQLQWSMLPMARK